MSSYVENTLSPGEKIIYRGQVSVWSLLPLILIGLILCAVWIGPLFWIAAAIRYYTTELAITNKKIIAKFGFIRRETVELFIKKVESVQVKQSILGRLFDFGSIVISGAGNPQAPIPGISNPMGFRKKIMELQDGASSESNNVNRAASKERPLNEDQATENGRYVID